MLRLAAIALILGGAYMLIENPSGLGIAATSGGSYSGAAQPAVSGIRNAASGMLN